MERYIIQNGCYVLYFEATRILATEVVSLIIDTALDRVVTHGDPVSVRCELDHLRAAASRCGVPPADQPWMLLEACPPVDHLNDVLAGCRSPHELRGLASLPRREKALELARATLSRIARRAGPGG